MPFSTTPIMYCARGRSQTTSNLYTVDTSSGVATSVGATGFGLTGLAFDPTSDGSLYGVTNNNSGAHPHSLVSIDPTTGAGTFIADLGASCADIAFDQAGQLYGLFNATPSHLKKIDKVTGAVTDVGSVGFGSGCGNGIGIDSADNGSLGSSFDVYTLDITTGATVDLGSVSGVVGGGCPNAASYDDSDTLWWLMTTNPGVSHIYTVDPGALTVTLICTASVNDFDAMVWYLPPPTPAPSGTPSRMPLWRWAVTDLAGVTLTFLDRLASDRLVQPNLNAPLQMSGTVPSDSPEINILHTDNYPFMAEGVRQLYGFRREWDTVDPASDCSGHGYYVLRASTLILQMTDESGSGDTRSRFSAWDPWQYLFYRPIWIPALGGGSGPDRLLPQAGHTYPSSMRMDEIVVDILDRMLTNADSSDPSAAVKHSFLDWGWSAFYGDCTDSVIQNCATSADGWHIAPGTSIGQALQDICTAGYMDIILTPIYDPVNRPGILCELAIFAQSSNPDSGAGSRNYAAQFAYDAPGRSLVSFTDLIDGTQRANEVQYRNGTAGPLVTLQRDATSVGVYGEYWAEQTFPAQTQAIAVEAIAAEQLVLRKDYKQTLTVNPAPERSPEPWVDYFVGDRVPVFVGKAQRGAYVLGDNPTRGALPPGFTGSVPVPDPAIFIWQRVYGIPVQIDDNGVETVNELLVGPVGPPP